MAGRAEQRAGRLLQLLMRRDVAVDVFDDLGVELLLRVDRRTDQTPDEASEPALQRPVDRRRAVRQDLPAEVDWRHPRVVVGRGGSGSAGAS